MIKTTAISTSDAAWLLKNYRRIKSLLAMTESALKHEMSDRHSADAIYGEIVKVPVSETGLPAGGSGTSDKTARLAISMASGQSQAVKRYKSDIVILSYAVDQIDAFVCNLTEEQQCIIQSRYFNGKTRIETAQKLLEQSGKIIGAERVKSICLMLIKQFAATTALRLKDVAAIKKCSQ